MLRVVAGTPRNRYPTERLPKLSHASVGSQHAAGRPSPPALVPVAKTVRIHVWPPSCEIDSGSPLSPATPFVITAICWVLFGLTAIADSSSSPVRVVALVGAP